MCGINGLYHFNNSKTIKEAELVKMRDTLIHRGPDDAGIYISSDKKIGLGTRRLKIIDLTAAGHMPMGICSHNSKLSVWITYNGEIYNFQELRRDLEKRGHKFKSRTDTEVILKSYLEWGFNCVNKFNGMFAFAIWDENKKILFAARDHLGIKPFYYAVQDGAFYFGSEIKAILAHPDFKKELNEEGLSYYLTFSSVPAPFTMFKDIKKLPAAHYMIIKNGIIEEKEYWNPVSESLLSYGVDSLTENDYIEQVKSLLRNSIKKQMVSDVPFGCFLSGGIDSSTNAALMSETLGHPVETFSIGSHFEEYNEFQYSRKMAEFLGAKNHEIVIDENDLRHFLTKFAYHADDLNGDYVCFPMFYLAQLTRQKGVTVVQIGEGADEIFAGYGTYLTAFKLYQKWWRKLRRFPGPIRRGVWEINKLFTAPKFDFYKEYLRRLVFNQEPFWGLAIAFSDYQKEKLVTPEFKKKIPLSLSYSIVKNYYDEVTSIDPQADFLKKITYLEIKHRLPELLLARADKMTMAHSIEGRVPFLDRNLVELMLAAPTDLKFKNNEPKYILKKSVEGILPPEIIRRPKQGFSTPMNEWLKLSSPVSKEILGYISKSRIKERNILNYEYIEKMIASDRYQDNAHIFRLWNLITLSLWYDYWFK
ncbi:MAG TPA: asparagine synthase (glutamine-hydrolyzing) [Candidatus Jorgensenbacteria bacterium]|nr:asparagine synthase (glutamine-hydrolyzing) [Candidatus Jorgensenbacteria bacterium]